MDLCNRLLCKQTPPPVTHLGNVPHHKVGVEPLYQDIRVILVLRRVREVLPVGYFCPLDTDGADAVSALGAGAVHPVVDDRQRERGEQP